MSTPRRLLGGPSREPPLADPLPGYLCEQCQDAPAVLLVPAPCGGEIGVCAACRAQMDGTVAPRACSSPQARALEDACPQSRPPLSAP
jgi:hypothetical protein